MRAEYNDEFDAMVKCDDLKQGRATGCWIRKSSMFVKRKWVNDIEHVDGEIAVAAADYALPSQNPPEWSWAKNKAKSTRIDQLVKAGALIVAEIERLRRAEAKS